MSDSNKALKEKLLSSRKNGFDRVDAAELEQMEAYCKEYMAFLDAGKTERLCAAETVRLAEQAGYKPLVRGQALKAGDKVYVCNRGKSVLLAHVGSKPMSEGAQIAAAHIDSPRLDLKPNPLYEDNELAYFKTHYYGGIRKYQWVTIPMELHGVVALTRAIPSWSSPTFCPIWVRSRARSRWLRGSWANSSICCWAASPSETMKAPTG